MNAIAILILILDGSGKAITTVPFDNMPACLEAQKQVLAAERDYSSFHAICVWTGVKPR